MSLGLATRGYLARGGLGLATRGYLFAPGAAEIEIFTELRGTLQSVGVVFGLLQSVGVRMVDLIGAVTFFRSSSATWRVTVTDDEDDPIDITGATLEFQVKTNVGDADPPKISKAIGSGITLLAQSGATLGQADIAILPADTSDAIAMPEGLYCFDVVIVIGGARSFVVEPTEFALRNVVNNA